MNADEWNTKYPIGTVVNAEPGPKAADGGAVMRTRTRSVAWTLAGVPVVAVEGYPGGIHLDHVTPVPPLSTFRVQAWTTAAGDEEWSGVALIHHDCGWAVDDEADGKSLAALIAAAEAHTCPPRSPLS